MIDFQKKIENYPSLPIFTLYFNVDQLNEYWNFVSWSIDTSQDIIASYPENFDEKFPALSDCADEDEAIQKFDKIRKIFYNQLFVILYSYVEIFINDFIEEIYSKFFSEITYGNTSESSLKLLSSLKEYKENTQYAPIYRKLKFIKSFTQWKSTQFNHIEKSIGKYGRTRNLITHHQSKIPNDYKYQKDIPEKIIDSNNRIILDSKYFEQAMENLILCCIQINNEIIARNPELSKTSRSEKDIMDLFNR